ncbi:MAG: hypothetical protein ACOYT8_05370 [Candidatus Dependentiae bacterium]
MKKIFIILSFLCITGLGASENLSDNPTPGKHNLKFNYSHDLKCFFGESLSLESNYGNNQMKYGFWLASAEIQKTIEEAGLAMGAHPIDIATWPVHELSESAKKNESNLCGVQTPTGIWLDTTINDDLIKFVAYHEVAHLILKHSWLSKSEYQKEFEADELAFNTLHKLNKMDIILAKIADRNFVENNYNVKDSITNFWDKKEKISYPSNKEKALYYKKIVENLPNKKTNLPKKLLQKNRNLFKKEFLKPGNIAGNIGTAAFLLFNSYYWAKEYYKANNKAENAKTEFLDMPYLENVFRDRYNKQKNIALIATGLTAGATVPFLWPVIKTGRATLLFRKKGLI